MPQFDIYSFQSLVLWTIFSFFFLHFLTVKFFLADFAELLKMRRKLYNLSKKNNVINKDLYVKQFYSAFFVF